MRLSVTWILAMVVFGFGLPVPEVASAGDRDVLFFSRDGWVWRCDADGGGRARLVEGFLPAARPDGRAVAFFRTAGPSGDLTELWVHDLHDGKTRRLARDLPAASAPVWLHDGSALAVLARDDRARTRIVILAPDGSGLRTVFSEGDEGSGFLCSLSAVPDGSLLAHDMAFAYWLDPNGGVRKRVPLEAIMGSDAAGVTSSDRLSVCPADPDLLVFSHACRGTARFESVMHEPNTTLSLHDRWMGKGKNMRVLPEDMTGFDPVWSPDGMRIYFIGYRDVQASDDDLFRIFRVERFGSGLKELGMGETVSVGGPR
jgi:hypothetical protein